MTSDPTKLESLKDNPLKSEVVDAESGTTLHHVTTKTGLTYATTTLSTASGEVQTGRLVANEEHVVELLDAETEAVVARSERKKLFSHSSRMSLTLEPELGQLVESVLFAFIILEERSRETAAGAAGASSASAASSVAAAVA
ncbi:hypothetical protein C8Q74DRAFT_1370234 [Fomes fomentarius]|nr:hypothetical protein C8Q74DRAFT_1370234 [Fomes fomentarius]